MGWAIIHWFELGTLALLCLNLWFVSSVLNVLRETNRWLAFLTRVRARPCGLSREADCPCCAAWAEVLDFIFRAVFIRAKL